jgi:hypothetical protein
VFEGPGQFRVDLEVEHPGLAAGRDLLDPKP